MHTFSTPLTKGVHPRKQVPCFGFLINGAFVVDVTEDDVCLADKIEQQRLNTILEDAIDAALNAGCLAIQEKMGIETGDVAGLYFSGADTQSGLALTMRDYLAFELEMGKDGTT